MCNQKTKVSHNCIDNSNISWLWFFILSCHIDCSNSSFIFYDSSGYVISGQFINYSIGQFYLSFYRNQSKPFDLSLYKFYLSYIDCQDIARRFSPTLEGINSLGALSNVPQNAFRIKRSVDVHSLTIVVLHQQNLCKNWC